MLQPASVLRGLCSLLLVPVSLAAGPALPAGAAPEGITLRYSTTGRGGLDTATARDPVGVPEKAGVSHARLYWWADLPEAGGIATIGFRSPGASGYTQISGELEPGEGGYQATADVTEQVKSGGNGQYEAVAGQWTLVVAYTHDAAPYRQILLADGLAADAELTLDHQGTATVGWIGYGDQAATVNGQPVDQGGSVPIVAGSRFHVAGSGNGRGLIGALYAAVDLPAPDLTVEVSAAAERYPSLGDPVIPGVLIAFTYKIKAGPGADLIGLSLLAPIPQGTTLVSGPGQVEWGQMWVPLGRMAAGAATELTMTVRAGEESGGSSVRGTAAVIYAPAYLPDFSRTAIGWSPAIRITPAANLALHSRLDVTDAWRYTVKISNAGPSAASDIVLREAVHTVLGQPEPVPGCTFTEQLLTCQVGALAKGASVELVLTLRPQAPVPPGTKVPNAASVAAATLDPDPGDNAVVTAVTH